MTIDIRTRQAGTMFSMGVEDEQPQQLGNQPAQRVEGRLRRFWAEIRMALGSAAASRAPEYLPGPGNSAS